MTGGMSGQPRQLAFGQTNEDMYKATLQGYQNQLGEHQRFAGAIAQGWDDLYKQQAGYGQSHRTMLNNQYDQQLAQQQASLADRGIWNTGVYDSMTRGVNQDRNLAMLSLEDQLANRQNAIGQGKLGWQAGAANDYLNIYSQGLGYQGGAQQARQAQDVQMASQYDQMQAAWQGQQSQQNWQSGLQGQQQQYAREMQQAQFQNQDYIQRTYGYF